MTLPASGPISLGAIRTELGSTSTNFDIVGHPADMLIGNNTDTNRKLTDFYGKSAVTLTSGSSISPATYFPQVTTGDCFYVDIVGTGGWDNGGNAYQVTLTYGTSSSGAWNTSNGNGKNNYWNFSFDGTSLSSTGYYAGGSTNYAGASSNVARIKYVGTGLSPTYSSLGVYSSTYYASTRYRG
jgi:hypothetical protein